jgi:hypothetical protein
MKADEAKRLRQLETENARLKKLLAEAELDKAMLKELAEETFNPGAPPSCRGSPGGSRASSLVDGRQVVQRDAHLMVIGAEHPLEDTESLAQEHLRLRVIAEGIKDGGERRSVGGSRPPR